MYQPICLSLCLNIISFYRLSNSDILIKTVFLTEESRGSVPYVPHSHTSPPSTFLGYRVSGGVLFGVRTYILDHLHVIVSTYRQEPPLFFKTERMDLIMSSVNRPVDGTHDGGRLEVRYHYRGLYGELYQCGNFFGKFSWVTDTLFPGRGIQGGVRGSKSRL